MAKPILSELSAERGLIGTPFDDKVCAHAAPALSYVDQEAFRRKGGDIDSAFNECLHKTTLMETWAWFNFIWGLWE